MKEIWKEIPGYEGHYMASNHGRIKSLAREVTRNKNRGVIPVSEKILKQFLRSKADPNDCYYSVNLSKNKKVTLHNVHRLIMLAFYGDSGLIVDHINGDKHDNRLENLRYCTYRENSFNNYRYRSGGTVGVTYRKDRKKWKAKINYGKRTKTIGHFDTKEEAFSAYLEAYNNDIQNTTIRNR